jgi:hypothetical protein
LASPLAKQKLRVKGRFRHDPRAADQRDAIDLARRLRDGRTGRDHHGAEQSDEITPLHERLRNDHPVRIVILAGYCKARNCTQA